MYLPNSKLVDLTISEIIIIGGNQKIGSPCIVHTPMLPFLQNFWWVFLQTDPANIPAKFEVCSFTRSWDDSDCSFGPFWVGIANPQSWGRGGRRESGMVPFERALVRWPSVLDFPGQSFISGSCPGFHSVLDLSWIWSLLSDPSLEHDCVSFTVLRTQR